MAKTYSKPDLLKMAAAAFAANSGVDKLLYTADGNFFLPGKESFAKMHAKDSKQKLQQISKSEVKAATKSASKSTAKPKSTAATSVKPKANPVDEEQNAANSNEKDDSSTGKAAAQLPEISKSAQDLLDDAGVPLEKFLESQEGEVKRVTVKMVENYINNLPKL